jgi:hypothetical protein
MPSPVHEPFEHVSMSPTSAVPAMAGAAVLCGAEGTIPTLMPEVVLPSPTDTVLALAAEVWLL